MPSVYFTVRWPDQTETSCYSPSTVIHTYFKDGEEYKKEAFLAQARLGLHAASERVREKFGYACSSAMDSLSQIEHLSEKFPPESSIQIVAVD